MRYAEEAPNAWHRRVTQKAGNNYNETRSTVNRNTSQTNHQASCCAVCQMTGV